LPHGTFIVIIDVCLRLSSPVLSVRSFFVVVLSCLLAVMFSDAASSQFRPVEQAPAEPLPVRSGSAETGADADRFYDGANPDSYKLQKAEEARASLPLDKRGAIDWMNALRSGAINPRDDVTGARRNEVLDLDVILKNTKEMPFVKFPHRSHTEWLACSNCHDKPFVPKAGANPITMEKIFRGEYCGMCHDRVAFITHYSCERCHSVPQGDGKKWW
jgi:c(7)-type cytochrome triheme protein